MTDPYGSSAIERELMAREGDQRHPSKGYGEWARAMIADKDAEIARLKASLREAADALNAAVQSLLGDFAEAGTVHFTMDARDKARKAAE